MEWTTNRKAAALAVLASLTGAIIAVQSCVETEPVVAPSPSPSVVVPSPSAAPSPPAPSALPSPIASTTPSPSPRPSPSASASPSPVATPSPSPKPSVSPSPSPTSTPTATPTGTSSLYGSRGEVLTLRLEARASGCTPLAPVAPAGVSVTGFTIETVTTLVPSFQGATVGAHEDPLVPTTQLCQKPVLVDVAIGAGVAPGKYSVTVAGRSYPLTVWKMLMPTRPAMPLYLELQAQQLLRAHGHPEDANVSISGPLAKQYIDLYRAHRIEPIKQNVLGIYPPADVNAFSAFNASFKQLVLDGAISPPCLFGPAPTIPPTTSQLADFEAKLKSGVFPADSWAYPWDEGEGDAALTADALTRVKLIKAGTPSLALWITRQEDPAFVPYVTGFIPVFDWFKQPGKVQTYTKFYGLYGSCMANGNCQNQASASTVKPATGTPMMVLDAPGVHQRAYLIAADQLGAFRALYFNGTQRLPTAWDAGGQYNEGGNGDGTLVYPGVAGSRGFTTHQPVASLRMKRLRASSYDVEYRVAARAVGIAPSPTLVSSAFSWSKDEAAYEAERVRLGEALNARP